MVIGPLLIRLKKAKEAPECAMHVKKPRVQKSVDRERRKEIKRRAGIHRTDAVEGQ